MLDMFKKFAVSPEAIPDAVFAAIGRTVWQDIGATAVGFRLMMKVLLSLPHNSLEPDTALVRLSAGQVPRYTLPACLTSNPDDF